MAVAEFKPTASAVSVEDPSKRKCTVLIIDESASFSSVFWSIGRKAM
jgi:hypothetical protein